jgi:hypothetical protein
VPADVLSQEAKDKRAYLVDITAEGSTGVPCWLTAGPSGAGRVAW